MPKLILLAGILLLTACSQPQLHPGYDMEQIHKDVYVKENCVVCHSAGSTSLETEYVHKTSTKLQPSYNYTKGCSGCHSATLIESSNIYSTLKSKWNALIMQKQKHGTVL